MRVRISGTSGLKNTVGAGCDLTVTGPPLQTLCSENARLARVVSPVRVGTDPLGDSRETGAVPLSTRGVRLGATRAE